MLNQLFLPTPEVNLQRIGQAEQERSKYVHRVSHAMEPFLLLMSLTQHLSRLPIKSHLHPISLDFDQGIGIRTKWAEFR